ncbi:hypothetical protein DYQ86_11150 [Acidobacteria bacterium AB60]|nr:hypothetical protein DYQ86_11150 [Acidobacteria bacterium AB60]
MTNLELEALRRQLEEDYKLDIAAIERLQRRFNLGGGPKGLMPGVERVERTERVERQAVPDTNLVPLPPSHEPRGGGQQGQPDELTESLRTMFSSYRK